MSHTHHIDRRSMIAGLAAAGTAAAVSHSQAAEQPDDPTWKVTKGRINQSVVHWCFKPMPVEDLARGAAAIGLKSVELVAASDWPVLKQHGLTCAIASSHGFVKGWNDKANWDFCAEKITAAVSAAAEFGCPSVITFSGMRGELPAGAEGDEIGKRNFIEGIKRVLPLAEQKKVTLALEMLNSRVDVEMKGHPGYQCDSIEWAVDVVDRVGSDRLKILFDIYHVQIMQGDVITRLKQFKDYIAHIHTAGNPGRNEIDDTQEINYPGIMRAVAEIGYKGFVGQEFIPTWKDPIAALRHAAKVCDV
ncbi:MAG: TIM barrel protein [Planctomycetaceae bacterium]|nr:TIM barrel protein [Planctomycetaceae bacterium]